MTENKSGDEAKEITEIGRELLKYLYRRLEDLGAGQASYRQARMELLRIVEENRSKPRFNWGFEAVFTQEIHLLEEIGLVVVKYGSGAIMAGRTNPNSIYNVSLTEDGLETARAIVEREIRTRPRTEKVESDDTDEEETDETDRSDGEETVEIIPTD